MKGVLLAFLVLWQFFYTPGGSGILPSAFTKCQADSRTCYSAQLVRLAFQKAQEACMGQGGGLSTANNANEVSTILALLGNLGSTSGIHFFWLGLVRKAQQCTREDLPLRGFSWTSDGDFMEMARNKSGLGWLREPSKSCTVERCAGLQVMLGGPHLEPWGLRDHPCTKTSAGYICKYIYGGGCSTLKPSSSLRYILPHSHLQSAAVEFSPPGTELTLRCPGGQEAHFTCRLSTDGYHWEREMEERLCSCPSGYWSPREAACMQLDTCQDPQGAFFCLCALGSRLGTDAEACLQAAQNGGAASTSQPGLPSAVPSNSTVEEHFPTVVNGSMAEETPRPLSDSSNYVFILITVAVVMLVILVMAALQVFQLCFRRCSPSSSASKEPAGKDGAAIGAEKGDPEASATCTNSEHSLGPSKAESLEASPEEASLGGQLTEMD
ncbi:C-type lectin domain family 14 member A [Anolis sagrei]|uniref:C-type lectin domain family 14 member A n=1 Tax=Anolis sagrei TaxID=38937 RepID=UPI0035200A0B